MKYPATISILGLAVLVAAQEKIDSKNWQVFTSRDNSFSIKAPPGWSPADLSGTGAKESMAKLREKNPKLAKMFEDTDKTKFDLYLINFDSDFESSLDNLNVKSSRNTGITPARYTELAKSIERNQSMTQIGWKIITLNAGSSLSYWGTVSVDTGDGHRTNLTTYGFLLVRGNTTYICSMTTSAEKAKTMKKIFDEMAETISIK